MPSTQKLLNKGVLNKLINESFCGLTQDLSLLKKFNENVLSSLIMNSATRVLRNETLWLEKYVYLLSHVQLFAPPWTIACQASLAVGFP